MNKGLNKEWKNALLKVDIEKIEILCKQESILNMYTTGIVKPSYEWKKKTPYVIAIAYVIPIERLTFIIENFQVPPETWDLDYAIFCGEWEMVTLFHDYGLRHSNPRNFLRHILYEGSEEKQIELYLCYTHWWNNILGCDYDKRDVYHHKKLDVAKFRKQNAMRAGAALLCLKGIVHKDVTKMIRGIIVKPKNMARQEWGYPTLESLAKHDLNYFAAIGGTVLISLFMALLTSVFDIVGRWIRG